MNKIAFIKFNWAQVISFFECIVIFRLIAQNSGQNKQINAW